MIGSAEEGKDEQTMDIDQGLEPMATPDSVGMEVVSASESDSDEEESESEAEKSGSEEGSPPKRRRSEKAEDEGGDGVEQKLDYNMTEENGEGENGDSGQDVAAGEGAGKTEEGAAGDQGAEPSAAETVASRPKYQQLMEITTQEEKETLARKICINGGNTRRAEYA
jgi:hypothetical protein